MKCQVSWNWRKSRTELVVTSQKRERLALQEAEWLGSAVSPLILPAQFDYSQAQAKRARVRYDIMGLTKLSKLLRGKTIDIERVLRILEGLEEVVNACVDASMQLDKMLFDPGFVYMDGAWNPHFVYVPFTGLQYDQQLNSPLTMLAALSEPKRMNYQTAEGESQRDALHRYVQNSKVFSANEFSKLLDREFRVSREMVEWTSSEATRGTAVCEEVTPLFMADLFADSPVSMASDGGFSGGYVIQRSETDETYGLPLGHVATMGSSPQCEFVVADNRFMEAQHLTLTAAVGGVTVVDCGTKSGTFAHNVRLAPYAPVLVGNGDCFLVGGEAFVVRSCEA